MNKIIKFPERSKIREQASSWLLKLDGGNLTAQESLALRQWLEDSPEHRNAIVELSMLWDDMDILAELSELFPLTGKPSTHSRKITRFFDRPLVPAAAIAAVITLSIITLFQFNPEIRYPEPENLQPYSATVYRTSVGEQINASLPDGSATHLNTDSEIEVLFNDKQRNIKLIRGEAHFQVAHDKARPFLVFAGTGIVRAVGTAFSVHLRNDNVEVLVTEGRVDIVPGVESSSGPIPEINEIPLKKFVTTISAGQSAKYGIDSVHLVQTVRPEIIEQKLSWQRGMLMFKGEPLEQVVEEINRYTNTEIIISDPGIRNIRVGGYFKTGETEALLNVLKDNFSITINRVNEHLVYLSRVDDNLTRQSDQ